MTYNFYTCIVIYRDNTLVSAVDRSIHYVCNADSQFLNDILLVVALHNLVHNMEIVHGIFLLIAAPENIFLKYETWYTMVSTLCTGSHIVTEMRKTISHI